MKMRLLSIALCTVAVAASAADTPGSGNTTLGVTATELAQVVLGLSVKQSFLGKGVYNEHGDKVGTVEDLIIDPARNVSYVIVGAGGFIGFGRHDVAIPVAQLRVEEEKVILPGATKQVVEAMPEFDYSSENAAGERFIARAGHDIDRTKKRVGELRDRAAVLAGEARTKIDRQASELQRDLDRAETKMSELTRAGARRWKEFEADLNEAVARMNRSFEMSAV